MNALDYGKQGEEEVKQLCLRKDLNNFWVYGNQTSELGSLSFSTGTYKVSTEPEDIAKFLDDIKALDFPSMKKDPALIRRVFIKGRMLRLELEQVKSFWEAILRVLEEIGRFIWALELYSFVDFQRYPPELIQWMENLWKLMFGEMPNLEKVSVGGTSWCKFKIIMFYS